MFVLVVLLLPGHVWSPQEYITYEFVPASPAVSCMSGSSNLNSFRDGRQVAVQLVSCGVLPPRLVQDCSQHSTRTHTHTHTHIYIYMYIYIEQDKPTKGYIFGVIDDFSYIHLLIFANMPFDFKFFGIQKNYVKWCWKISTSIYKINFFLDI